MKHQWEMYRDKVLRLREVLREKAEGGEVEMEVVLPGEEGYDSQVGVPYVRVRYYGEDAHHDRRIDLYEYHLKKDFEDLVNLIEHFVQEFEMEIDQTEYGGG